jgi:MoaA/NifB/PqqE/SkfB family radical SAM enzyme
MDGLTSLLAVSLDSHLPEVNERNRERSERVRDTVQMLASRKEQGLLTCQLGIYVVVTRSNLAQLPAYAAWLADTGVDYVNVQPVYLPADHPSAEESILRADSHAVAAFYSDLAQRGLKTSSSTMQQIALASLEGVRGVATECFADRGDYFYISPSGVVTGCPVKSGAVIGLGSARGGRWVHGARRLAQQGAHSCDHLCGDCLGMYEMASGDHGVVHTA